MATVGNERYLRHIWLLGDGGLLILRGIVSREASTCGQPFEKFLDGKRIQFNKLLDPQRLKLFPDHSTVNTDTKLWDMSLLTTVVRRTFWANLPGPDKAYIKTLKIQRDELKAHPNCMSMEENDYIDNSQLLKTALCHLASGLSAETNTQLQDIIKCAESEAIDIKSALRHITELNEFKETFLQELEKSLSQVTSEIQKMHSSVNNLKADINTMGKDQLERHHDLSAGVEELNVVAKKSQEDISEIKEQVNVLTKLIFGQMNRTDAVAEAKRTAVKELEIILHMNCEDKDKREKATDVLYDMIQLIQTGHTFSEEKVREMIYQKIRENGKVTLQLIEDVLAWFKCIDAIPDSCLGFAYKGSIRIPIYWFSEDASLSHLHYMDSSEGLHCRREISSTLSEILGFSCFIFWSVVPDSLTDVLKVQSKTSEAKTTVLPFHCKSDHGLIDIQKHFGKKNKQTEKISKTLSDIFDAKITLKTCIDIDQLQKSMFKSNLSLPSNESKKLKESSQSLLDSEGISYESKIKESPQSVSDPEGISLPPYESKKMKESPQLHLGPEVVPPRSFESKKMMGLSKSRSNPEGMSFYSHERVKMRESSDSDLNPQAPIFGDMPDSFCARPSLPRPRLPFPAGASFRVKEKDGQQENSLPLELLETYSIRDKTDVFDTALIALEMLPKEGFILIDVHNKKLKKLDKGFKTVSVYDLSETPWDVCYIGEGKAAVSLGQSGILFADVSGNIKMDRVVSLNIFCVGCASFGNTLYICDDEGSIYTYTFGDEKPRLLYQGYQTNIFLRHPAVSQSGEKVYMVCFPGIITINADGSQLATLQHVESVDASGICVIDDGTILVSDLHSNNVIQINSEGTKILRTFTLHNIRPYSICYDRQESRLIVGSQDTHVQVYKLPALNKSDI